MRRGLVLFGVAGALVVGKTKVLRAAGEVTPRAATVKAGGKRCAVAKGTPLAALRATRLKVAVRDYGACGKRAADGGQLFVRSIAGEAARGQDGWVYKRGNTVPSLGAADPAAAKRKGPLLWFWCVSGKTGCQRTLGIDVDADVASAGQPLGVTVRGYDDRGRSRHVAGATVTAPGGVSVVTDADGNAQVPVPADASGSIVLTAVKDGLVRSFPVKVRVL